ncbi:radical SAM/SPASM domain-containing protein [Hamadaea tsunoensis]|uniref:radical SAM/SPASM domain-containing protein n=1 Tax=Hamadaea tsunoensis TaxID=53368 RepID=UPI000404F588|nr:radical SAM/SPASM domain-containing protein [Hamadaea tsunoensis]
MERLIPSRYLTFSDVVLRHRSGAPVRAVFHAATARTLVLDTTTVDALRAGALERLPDGDLRTLAQLGLVVPAGTDEPAAVIEAGRRAAEQRPERQFVIMPTAYCNMGCDYCGQEHQRGPQAPPGRHRDALTARVTAAMTGDGDVRVRWFGGEPLMGFATIRALSAAFVAAAERTGTRYGAMLVTNGALLDARKLRALHHECRVDHIEVTVDGTEDLHNASRPLKSGQASYPRIIAALRAFVADETLAGLRITVRTNIGPHNAEHATAFAEAMRDAGLAHPRLIFYPAAIHSWGNDISEYALSPARMARIETDWLAAYQAAGLSCRILPNATKPVVCTATTKRSEVVAPDGAVFSCTEQPLVPGYADRAVGTLSTLEPGEERPDGDFDDWYAALQRNETGCRECPILPLCGGSCPKLWREGKPPCPPLRTNIKDRLDLVAPSLV